MVYPLFPDVLMIENLPTAVSEQELAQLFEPFGAVNIQKDERLAKVHFVIGHQANKAFATLNGRLLQDFSDKARIEFQCPLPLPESRTGLLVKNVPSNVTQYQLFDRFSPFGPIYSCSVISKASSTQVTATVQFFLQQDAHMALQEMHCSDIDGQLISVSPMDSQNKLFSKQSSRQSSSSTSSADNATVKSSTQLNIAAAPFNPSFGGSASTAASAAKEPSDFDTRLLQQQQQFIDYCNLYIKNLDEAITSTDLFQQFKPFGRIVSARVIANAATNQSRGYGFVSYSRPEEASYALNQMNGAILGTKAILVAYHEPKKPRILPLSPKSPVTSESGGSQVPSLPPSDSPSLDAAADLYHDLYNSIVSTGLVWESNSQQVTEILTQLPRHEQVNLLTQPLLLIEKIKDIRDNLGMSPVIEIPVSRPVNIRSPSDTSVEHTNEPPISKQRPTSVSTISSSSTSPESQQTISLASLLASNVRGGIPESITQRLGQDGLSTPGSSSAPDQRQRMIEAVHRVDSDAGDEIIDMLMTLSSKERSLCIFNTDYLSNRIIQAREALDVFADEEDAGPIDIRPLMHLPHIPKNAKEEDESAEALYRRISNLSLYEQKQQLGDKLFPLVKATGVRQAPKVTIRLLDSIDLQRLSQIMTVDNPELISLTKSTFDCL